MGYRCMHTRWPKLISALSVGSAVATVCGVFAWLSFSALTMMMNPDLAGEAYWSTVRSRAASDPVTASAAALFGIGSAAGVALMVAGLVRFWRGGR